jgi:hypothetical protein
MTAALQPIAAAPGTNALTFSYTVAPGRTRQLSRQPRPISMGRLSQIAVAMPPTCRLSGLTQPGPQIDALQPTVTAVTESHASGVLEVGATVTLTLGMSEAVTVAGGTPTLTLNDGGTATYSGGSGTSALTFSYTVGAGQNTAEPCTATAVNLNSATITDGAGNAANLSLSGLTQSGPQVAMACRPLRLTQATPPTHTGRTFGQRHVDDVEPQRSHYSGH